MIRKIKPYEYLITLEIWRRAVRKTHHFLSEKDIKEIEEEILPAFKVVDLYVYEDEEIKGFIGFKDEKIEMLFVDPSAFRQKIGSKLIKFALDNGCKYIEVNEDNDNAYEFYKKMGFEQYDYSEVDKNGRPFPIRSLKIKEN